MKEKISKKIKVQYQRIINSSTYQLLKRIFTLRGTNHFAPAALSFYLILSLIPCLVLIEIILSLINPLIEQNLSILFFLFPIEAEISSSIKDIISSLTTRDIFSLFISVTIIVYLASRGLTFFTLQVKNMYGIQYHKKSFIKRKISAVLLTILLLIILSFLIAFLIIFMSFLQIKNSFLYALISYGFVLLIMFVFIEFLYMISTEKSEKFKEVFWGSLFATLGIGIGGLFYFLYLKYLSSSLSYYGPLSLLALLYLMGYISSFILFFGVEINILIKEKS